MKTKLLLAVALLTSISCSAAANEANWPQFRGPEAQGVVEGDGPPGEWSETKNVAWRAEVAGKGWSSPIVWGEKVFVTAAVSDEKGRDPRKGLYLLDLYGTVPAGTHRWMVYCLDLKSGKTLWEREADRGTPTQPIHLKNSYASETPVTDGQRVYAYFGNVGLFCYSLEGEPLWDRRWEPVKTRRGWGTAASPVLHEGRVYVVNDNESQSFLAALDAATGEELWKANRDELSNWATPFVWQNDRRTEIITAGSGAVRSYSLDGEPLWTLGGMSSIAIPTPFAAQGLLYVTSGYVSDLKRPLFAIRPGASGDISLEHKDTSNEFIAWSQPKAGPYHPSPLVVGDLLYILYDRGTFACFDAKTGQEVYGQKRLGPLAFTASPWSYGGKIFCLSEDGETIVVSAGREFNIVGRNHVNEMCLATPAIAGDRLVLRSIAALYCIAPPDKQ